MANELDRTAIARSVLSAIRLRALSETLRKRRDWRERAFPGFRPDSITRSIATDAAPRFAASPRVLSDLLGLYIDDLEAEGLAFNDRVLAAASDPRVPPETQAVLERAAQVADFQQLPVGPIAAAPVLDNRHGPSPIADDSPATTAGAGLQTTQAQQASPESDPEPSLPRHARTASTTPILEAPPEFIWDPPDDDISEVQSALALFGRCFFAFVVFRLKALHGDAWLRKGCGPYRKRWREREERGSAADPETLLGNAQMSELEEVVVHPDNWKTFSEYFPSQEWFRQEFRHIPELRSAGAHPEQRMLYKTVQYRAFGSMCAIVDRFHPDTAAEIDLIWSEEQPSGDAGGETAADDRTRSTGELVEKNFDVLPAVELIGRSAELTRLHSFWDDDYQRSICVTGRGGVGKTALVYSFVNDLLRRPCPPNQRPRPELVLSLTAKDNWLAGQAMAPEEQRFGSLRRVLEALIDLCGGDTTEDIGTAELRDQALALARDMSCLIVLDNLETLPDRELEEIGTFIQRLPSPSKVITTDREHRGFGERFNLRGIDPDAAVSLVKSIAAHEGMDIPGAQNRAIRRVSEELDGVPLYLYFFANLLVSGHSASAALQEIRGNDMLWLLRFSFESSAARLNESARRLLYYLAHVPDSVTRSDLSQVVRDGRELDDAVSRLRNAHFIENVMESPEQSSFRISDPQLRDYVISQFPLRLSPDAASRIQLLAGAPVQRHPNIERAIQQLVQEANELGAEDWQLAYDRLQEARTHFGDANEITARLGYFAFRLRRRDEARRLLETAIAGGLQDWDAHRTLGLVYYYDRSLDEAIRQAEISLTLRPDEPRSLLLLGEATLEKARRSALAQDSSRRLEQARIAKNALTRSLIEDDFAPWQRGHNDRRARLIDKAEMLEESLAAAH